MKTTKYNLVHEEIVRDEDEILDQRLTVIKDAKSIEQLIDYAKKKGLSTDNHFIEMETFEYVDGLPEVNEFYINHLNYYYNNK